MITELTSQHNTLLNMYFKKLPMYSMFFISDIKKHNPTLYGCFEDEHLLCIFTKILNTLFIYSNNEIIPAKEILDFLNHNNISFFILKAQEVHAKQFLKYISFSTIHSALLCKLEKSNFKPIDTSSVSIIKATKANLDELLGFFNGVDEYKGLMSIESVIENINNGTYILYDNHNIASVAISNYYSRYIANISVLTTSPKFRGRGYGTKLLSYVCSQLLHLSDSISICHEYGSDKIYALLGFNEIGNINICIK